MRMSHAHWPPGGPTRTPAAAPHARGRARTPAAPEFQGGGARTPQNANHTSLLTYYDPPSAPNRDLFDNEIPVSVTKIACSLPSVQVTRGATSGNYRGT